MDDLPIDEPDADQDDAPGSAPSSSPARAPRYPAEDLLPKTTSDESELGWGDSPSEYSDDWYLAERPPHHE
jgi:hypothetical protein